VARMEFGLQTRTDAVEQPLKSILQSPDRPPAAIPSSTAISQVFDDQGSALLILGSPGAGKTTLLLELAQQLLDRAQEDSSHPLPVVFNLSSWAVRRRPLERWLVDELNERSDVPRKVAQHWVEAEQVLPLLDGLDEVAAEYRQGCAEAINNFRREHGLLPIAVCSRIGDYEALGTKLRLRSAIVVQPLAQSEVRHYLESIGERTRSLRVALREDPSFWELLETPLMLWVAMLAYRDAPVELSPEDSLEKRRRQLFANYVDAMFKRRAARGRYTAKQTAFWLGRLASALKRQGQTVFYVENVSEQWLPTRLQRGLARTAISIGIGVVCGVGFALAFGISLVLLVLFAYGLIFGLLFGLPVAFMELRPVEAMRFSLENLHSRFNAAMRFGGRITAILWLVVGSVFALFEDGSVVTRLTAGVLIGLIVGLFFGFIFGLAAFLAGEAVETRVKPNQGTYRSIKTAFISGAVVVSGCMLISLIVLWLLHFSRESGWYMLLPGWMIGCFLGMIVWLVSGGLFSLKHFALRLALWIFRSAPLRYVTFLNYAVERLFLRKVGGGYIFVHRMLLDYFASLSDPGASPSHS